MNIKIRTVLGVVKSNTKEGLFGISLCKKIVDGHGQALWKVKEEFSLRLLRLTYFCDQVPADVNHTVHDTRDVCLLYLRVREAE